MGASPQVWQARVRMEAALKERTSRLDAECKKKARQAEVGNNRRACT